MNAHTSIVTRASIDEIVGYRNQAATLFAEAYDAMRRAIDATSKSAGGRPIYVDREISAMAFSFTGKSRDDFLEEMRRRTDANAWNHLVIGYGFEKLMDRQATAEFRAQLEKDPPVLTAEVAEATMFQLMGDADKLFRRGIANAFAKLDRRFRSHDGFKIGTRVVLDGAFSIDTGGWSYHRGHEETLRDIERAFHKLDDKEMPERYAGIVGAVDSHRQGYRPASYQVEDDYFTLKVYKNGNAHLWFKRDDLLEKVNKLLAEHYGEVLGAGSDAVEEDPFARQSTAVARNMGWFPTPEAVVKKVLSRASIVWARGHTQDGTSIVRILEPSAGEGAIAMGAIEAMREGGATPQFTCVELHPERAAWLRANGFDRSNGHRVLQRDFLTCTVEDLGLFEYILMNPPFDRELDIDHVVHATKFLAPGGQLVAVTSAGVEFRTTRKAQAFRDLVARMKGEIYDLPPGSFEESGTMVNTCIVEMKAPRA